MKLQRRNVVLAGVVALLAVLQVTLERPVRRAESTAAVFAGLESLAGASDVRRIEIEGPADDRGPGALLELWREDGRWIVPQRYGLAAHAWSVEAFIAGLGELREADLVGQSADSWSIYGLGSEGTRVRVVGSGGVTLATLVQGAGLGPGPSGEPAGTYVRPAAGESAYRAARVAPLSNDPDAWLDTRLVDEPPERVHTLTLRSGAGDDVRLVREETTWNHAGGAEVDAGLVGALLAELTAAHFDGVVGLSATDLPPEDEWTDPAWVLTAHADVAHELVLAPPAGGDRRVVARSRDGTPAGVVRVPTATALEIERAAQRVLSAVGSATGPRR